MAAKTYKGFKLSKSKSKAGVWCTVIHGKNGTTYIKKNFDEARKFIDNTLSK